MGAFNGSYELSEQLYGGLKDRFLVRYNLLRLAFAYHSSGRTKLAVDCCGKGLESAQSDNNSDDEALFLGSLGICYNALGDHNKAIEYLEPTLTINRKTGNKYNECASLNSIENVYLDIGKIHKAIEYYELDLELANCIEAKLVLHALLAI